MKPFLPSLFLVGFMVATAAADDAKDEAIKKDRQQIEGTWRIVELVVNGNAANLDGAKRIAVVNGSDGSWTIVSEGTEVAKGTNSFDPTKTPKTIDFTITEGGGKGNVHRGIYELGEKARKLCFAPPGKDRPTEFTSTAGSEHVLVLLEREKE